MPFNPRAPSPTRRLFLGVWLSLTLIILPPCLHQASAQEESLMAPDPDLLYQAGNYRAALDIWMTRAFEGDPESQFRVGVIFTEGKGIDQDFEQSAYWYTQAARQGHTAAQYNLGHAYFAGAGIDKDEDEALGWWEAAARGGHELAQYNVGRAYYMGIGTEKHPETARFWFSQAARNGEPRSAEILERLGWDAVELVHRTPPPEPAEALAAAPAEEPAQEDALTAPEEMEVESAAPAAGDGVAALPPVETDTAPNIALLATEMTDGAPEAGQPVGAPLEERPPVGEQPVVTIPEPAPPDDLVSKLENWSPVAGSDRMETDKPVGSPLEVQAPVGEPPIEVPPVTAPAADPVIASVDPDAPVTEPAVEPRTTLIVSSRSESVDAPAADPVDEPVNRPIDEPGEQSGEEPVDSTPVNAAESPAGDIQADAGSTGLAVYSTPGTGRLLVGIVRGEADWRIIDRSGSWLRVTRTPGFPAWIHRDQVSLSGRYATITGERVNIRATPAVESSSRMGSVRRGQQLEIISEQGDWIRVVAPTNIAAWVQERDFDRQATPGTAPGGSPAGGWQTVGLSSPRDDEQWLFSQPTSWFTIQIISLTQEQGVLDFIRNLELGNEARYFTSMVDGRLWYVLRYGSYPSYEAARDASRELPVAGQTIWVRNFGILQRDRCDNRDNVPDRVRTGLEPWCNGGSS